MIFKYYPVVVLKIKKNLFILKLNFKEVYQLC